MSRHQAPHQERLLRPRRVAFVEETARLDIEALERPMHARDIDAMRTRDAPDLGVALRG